MKTIQKPELVVATNSIDPKYQNAIAQTAQHYELMVEFVKVQMVISVISHQLSVISNQEVTGGAA